jgi:DNA replication protein DnaC
VEPIGRILDKFPKDTLLQKISNLQNDYDHEELTPLESLRRDLNVSSLDNTFENFKIRTGTESAYQAFYDFATKDKPKPFLGCYGGVGCGKSHLMEATAIKLYQRGKFARVIPADWMYSALKRSMSEGSIPSYQDILESYCKAKILLLDDIGMGTLDSDWAYTVLEEIVLHRFHEKLPTAFVTNKDFGDLPPRVLSRFKDKSLSVLVLNSADDYRRQKG